MIKINIYKDQINQVKSNPNDNRLLDVAKKSPYPWVITGLTKSNSIEFVADHYSYDTVDIILKTESVSQALLGTLEIYDKIMSDGETHHSIKNL
jgi:hypothetical protein